MILYFTGTGNSRMIAEKLAELLCDTAENTFAAVREGGTHEFNSEKPYVFVCPTYAWDIPRIFRSFLLSSRFTGNRRAYFLMTCGGSIGDPTETLRKLCVEKGLIFSGVKAVVMPENYIAMFSVPDQEKSDRIIAQAMNGLPEEAEVIQNGGSFPKEKDMLGRLKSGPVNRTFYRFAIRSDRFRSDDTCIGCGTCETVCPLKNIQMKDGRPSWSDTCTHCMACISVCPEKAIRCGNKGKEKTRIYNGKVR